MDRISTIPDSKSIIVDLTPNNPDKLPSEVAKSSSVVAVGTAISCVITVVNNFSQTQEQRDFYASLFGRVSITASVMTAGKLVDTAVAYEIYQGSTRLYAGTTGSGVSLQVAPGTYNVRFGSISGYQTPGAVDITVKSQSSHSIPAVYYTDRSLIPNVRILSPGQDITYLNYSCHVWAYISDSSGANRADLLDVMLPSGTDLAGHITLPATGQSVVVGNPIQLTYPNRSDSRITFEAIIVERYLKQGRIIEMPVGTGGNRYWYIYEPVAEAKVIAAAAGAAAVALTEGEINILINTALGSLASPALSNLEVSDMVSKITEGLQGVMPDLGNLNISLPTLPELVGQLGDLKLATLADMKPPDVSLVSTKIKEVLAKNPADLLKALGKPGILPDVLIDFAYVNVENPGETAWMKCDFPKEFASPPTVVVSPQYRDGWFDDVSLTPPKFGVKAMTLADFQKLFPASKFTAPEVALNFPDQTCPTCNGTGKVDAATCSTCGGTGKVSFLDAFKAQLQKDLAPLMIDPATGAKALIAEVKKQAEAKIEEALGDWKVGVGPVKLDLNSVKMKVVLFILAVAVIIVAVTSPGALLLFGVTAGIVVIISMRILGYINSLADAQTKLQNALAKSQTAVANAMQDYTSKMGAALASFSNSLAERDVAMTNTASEHLTDAIQTAMNVSIPMLYNMSDLPAMKLPVCATRNITTTGFELLLPKGGKASVFIIGKAKNPLDSFLPRAMSQMNIKLPWSK